MQFKLTYVSEALEKWRDKYALLEVVGVTQTPPYKIPCETIALRLYKWYSGSPISDISTILNQDIEVIDFFFGDGVFRETMSFMPSQTAVEQHDVKRVSEMPLGSKSVKNMEVGNPSNPILSKRVAVTLDTHFNI